MYSQCIRYIPASKRWRTDPDSGATVETWQFFVYVMRVLEPIHFSHFFFLLFKKIACCFFSNHNNHAYLHIKSRHTALQCITSKLLTPWRDSNPRKEKQTKRSFRKWLLRLWFLKVIVIIVSEWFGCVENGCYGYGCSTDCFGYVKSGCYCCTKTIYGWFENGC
jgi:hypothetical protein